MRLPRNPRNGNKNPITTSSQPTPAVPTATLLSLATISHAPSPSLVFSPYHSQKKMLEDAVPSIWASVHSWFTPTVFFVLLNIVIGTIAVTSKGSRAQHHEQEHGGQPKLARSSSIVLERLRSFNFYRHSPADAQAPPPPAPKARPVETVHPAPDPTAQEASAVAHDPHLSRNQSDTHPTSGEVPEKLAGRMNKSASFNSAFAHFKEPEIAQRMDTARAEEEDEEEEDDAQEVDARADDFINRFRHQLKLQRLDSIMRYKEMLNHGKQ